MADEDELSYEIETEQGGYRNASTKVKAVPSRFAAKPEGEIRWPDALHADLRVEVNWSCGGMRFDIENARKFFNAGLAVYDALEAGLKDGPPKSEE